VNLKTKYCHITTNIQRAVNERNV